MWQMLLVAYLVSILPFSFILRVAVIWGEGFAIYPGKNTSLLSMHLVLLMSTSARRDF